MPNILAIDTTTSAFSIALQSHGEIFHHFEIAPQKHTLLALPTLDKLLKEAGITLKDLNVIAVTQGPGGFAGVRTGISIVQGLALGADLPVIGISTLALLAQKAFRLHQATHVLTALDARQQEVYWAAFINGDFVIPEQIVKPNDAPFPPANSLTLPRQAGEGKEKWYTIGSGWDTYSALLTQKTNFPLIHIPNEEPDALDLLPLAEKAFKNKQMTSASDLRPIYLRNNVTHAK